MLPCFLAYFYAFSKSILFLLKLVMSPGRQFSPKLLPGNNFPRLTCIFMSWCFFFLISHELVFGKVVLVSKAIVLTRIITEKKIMEGKING